MILYIKNIESKYKHLLFLDTEFIDDQLIQIAMLRFKRLENNLWELNGGYNQYLDNNIKLPSFFIELTGIDKEFLNECGKNLEELRFSISTALVKDGLSPATTLLIGHDLKCDIKSMKKTIDIFSEFENRFCTYTTAKKQKKELNGYTLTELAEQGLYVHLAPHNAYGDVWALVHVFEWLKNKL